MSKKGKPFTMLAHNIKRIKEQAKRNAKLTFAVTYTAPYATRVHEDLEMPHTNGQAKYLEQPLRENTSKMSAMVKDLMSKGKTLNQALRLVGEWLLEESKKLVPVDTGRLRDSGRVDVKRS